MAKTLLDLDENLLAEAAAALGTKTKKDTVTLALQKVSEDARARRTSALEDLLQAADADVFDYDRLADLDQ
jgi:Arc/MetJ family transcription regulator